MKTFLEVILLAAAKPSDLRRKVKTEGVDADVDGTPTRPPPWSQ
jgi:hypothetical protein